MSDLDLELLASIASGGLGSWQQDAQENTVYVKSEDCRGKRGDEGCTRFPHTLEPATASQLAPHPARRSRQPPPAGARHLPFSLFSPPFIRLPL